MIGTETEAAELVTARLSPEGALIDIAAHDLAPPYRDDDAERRIPAPSTC